MKAYGGVELTPHTGHFIPGKNGRLYPLNRRLETQGQSGCFGEYKNIWPLLGTEPQVFGYPVLSLLTILNMLSWIPALGVLLFNMFVKPSPHHMG